MPQKTPRKFGELPEWAKTGPITTKNYSLRAENHCSIHTAKREGAHPTLKLDSSDFALWAEYFDVHLAGRPLAFRMLIDKAIEEMTIPEAVPQWFDSSFVPTPGWKLPAPPPEPYNPELADRVRQILTALGFDFTKGKRSISAKPWKRYSDDELRARYRRQGEDAA